MAGLSRFGVFGCESNTGQRIVALQATIQDPKNVAGVVDINIENQNARRDVQLEPGTALEALRNEVIVLRGAGLTYFVRQPTILPVKHRRHDGGHDNDEDRGEKEKSRYFSDAQRGTLWASCSF